MSGRGRGRQPQNTTTPATPSTPDHAPEPKSSDSVRKRGSKKKDKELTDRNSEDQASGTKSTSASGSKAAEEPRNVQNRDSKAAPLSDVTTPPKGAASSERKMSGRGRGRPSQNTPTPTTLLPDCDVTPLPKEAESSEERKVPKGVTRRRNSFENNPAKILEKMKITTPATPDHAPEPKSSDSVRKRGSRKKDKELTDRNSEDQASGTKSTSASGSKAAAEPRNVQNRDSKTAPLSDVTTPPKEAASSERKMSGRGRGRPSQNTPTPTTLLPDRAFTPLPKETESSEERKVPKGVTRRGNSFENNPAKILEVTLEKMKIKKTERSESTRCVNDIQKLVTERLKRKLDWCKDIMVLKTGSHYENVKICESDEFDVMLAIPVERVDFKHYREDGAFYSVALKRHAKHPLDRFLNEDKTIRASEMLTEFRDAIKEAVRQKHPSVTIERKKKGCPAVTLVVKENGKQISLDFVLGLEIHSQSWPEFTKNGFDIDNWLGKKVKHELKLKPFYLVAKYEGNGNTEHNGVPAKDAWRISFSHIEKTILKNHGNTKTCCEGQALCCRKQCLKLLKYLLQRLKEKHPEDVSKFCSYYAKTTLLHACVARVKDSMWALALLHDCFQQLLDDFVAALRKRQLCNFFIPSHNLLSAVDKKRCDFLADCIEYQRNNGFPIFQ